MPESTLNLDQFDLEAEVADFAGYGLGPHFGQAKWDEIKQNRIDRSVKSGLRMVYFTREMEGVPGAYDWSFLRPTSHLTLANGTNLVRLPDDCGGLSGSIIPASTSGEAEFSVAITGYSEVYGARGRQSSAVGRPAMAYCEAIRGVAQDRSSRYQLQVYPTADRDYSLQVWYYLLPDATSTSLPFVYGGAAHAETFKSAVRAAYERDFDNVMNGPEWMRFLEQLRASIAYDRKFKPLTIGQNRDRSDDYGYGIRHGCQTIDFFVNGVPLQ